MYQVSRTGIHIYTTVPWLAASPPDGVKNPIQAEGRQNAFIQEEL